MADLTTEEIRRLRDRLAIGGIGMAPSFAEVSALLDMAERCAKAEAELARLREDQGGAERVAIERSQDE